MDVHEVLVMDIKVQQVYCMLGWEVCQSAAGLIGPSVSLRRE